MVALYFDLDGTLIQHTLSFEEMFERARRTSNVPDHDGLHERYVTTFLEYFSNCHPEPYRAAMADLCTEFSLSTDGDTFAEALVESELSNVEVTDGVHDLLNDLSADHQLGVLTNGAGYVQRAKLDVCGLETYFDTVVASCEVGARKPESEIFTRAKDELPADEYVFVADDLERDVLPAQEAGFLGVCFSESTESRADVSIEDLSAVRDAVV